MKYTKHNISAANFSDLLDCKIKIVGEPYRKGSDKTFNGKPNSSGFNINKLVQDGMTVREYQSLIKDNFSVNDPQYSLTKHLKYDIEKGFIELDYPMSADEARPVWLKPKVKTRLIDCVSAAGFDISDWSNFKGKYPASNPKYCYEWSFNQGDKVLLNIWYEDLEDVNGLVQLVSNFRDIEKIRKDHNQKGRARKSDQLVQKAFTSNLLIRVILQTGDLSVRHDPKVNSAKSQIRELDDYYWKIIHYDNDSGDFELIRLDEHSKDVANASLLTSTDSKYLRRPTSNTDEFELKTKSLPSLKGELPPRGTKNPAKKSKVSNSRERSPEVKRWLLDNTGNVCECCLVEPFLRSDGSTYREIHHLKKLADDGSDRVENAVAICANCHRELHFGANNADLLDELYSRISRLERE
jgi:5-methylcytosine-specific restriction enzyme A